MRAFIFCLFCSLAFPVSLRAEIVAGEGPTGSSFGDGPNISAQYLRQAREYRAEGRFELARQSYVQALSTCRDNDSLYNIRRELAGIELLIRTMR